jgi:[protein-PII] uridylyltransferase
MENGTMNNRIQEALRLWRVEWTDMNCCLCVSGSVARNEDTGFSDLDLLVIRGVAVRENLSSVGMDTITETIVAVLSAGVDHCSITVRSIADIPVMLDADIRSWVAQMDAVLITGDSSVYCEFRKSVRNGVRERRDFILSSLQKLKNERHRQYGSAVALLEPNIKNSAGTLRDIHTIYYIGILDIIQDIPVSADPWPDVMSVLSRLSLKEQRRKALADAYVFFLSVRRRMHEISGHLHDSLDFELQQKVSEAVGFSSRDARRGVELFMRSYYAHARTVHVAVQLVFYDSMQIADTEENETKSMILLPEWKGTIDDLSAMRLFLKMVQTGGKPAAETIRAMDNLGSRPFSSEAVKLFDRIVREDKHVADTLMFMHEHGILAAVLPEFSPLQHFFQHNIYHFFTADEHTLRAIRAVETTLCEDDHASSVLSQVKDRSVLHYAILLHDIAKPVDLPRHEHVGADLVPEILRRFGRSEIAEDVAFLVREHLKMEQLAFRRDIREITTLRPFIELVQTVDRLNLLYLLTLADMAALNPGVLTDWKKELLRELYAAARRLMETGESTTSGLRQSLDDSRLAAVMGEREYSVAVQDVIDGELVRIHFQHHRAYSEVTIFCIDRPQLLAQFSAAFFGADCSIVDASIRTQNDVVIDTFRLVDIFSSGHLRNDQAIHVKQLIRSVCAGEVNAEQLFDRYRRKWVRKLKKLPKNNVTVDVAYLPHLTAEGKEQTIVEVYAPDTFGLLYRLSSELSSFGLNVVFAKIATRVDGVVDSFYVVDSEGRAFTDEQQRRKLRQRLLDQITNLTV